MQAVQNNMIIIARVNVNQTERVNTRARSKRAEDAISTKFALTQVLVIAVFSWSYYFLRPLFSLIIYVSKDSVVLYLYMKPRSVLDCKWKWAEAIVRLWWEWKMYCYKWLMLRIRKLCRMFLRSHCYKTWIIDVM